MKEMVLRFLCTHVLLLLLIVNLAVSNYKSSSEGILEAIRKNASVNGQNNSTVHRNLTIAPLIFPKNDSKHHFLDNTTILQNLAFHDSLSGNNNNNNNKTEAEDLRRGGEYSKIDHGTNLVPSKSKAFPIAAPISKIPRDLDPNDETELIENGSDTEDRLLDDSHIRKLASELNYDRDSHGPGVPLVQGQMAAILAGVFVILSVIGYIGLLSWRRFLENRYGNREMLVNEDDFNDPRDMGHFSL